MLCVVRPPVLQWLPAEWKQCATSVLRTHVKRGVTAALGNTILYHAYVCKQAYTRTRETY